MEVEVVPAAWVSHDMRCWPKAKPERIKRLVKDVAEPLKGWPQYLVEVKGVFGKL